MCREARLASLRIVRSASYASLSSAVPSKLGVEVQGCMRSGYFVGSMPSVMVACCSEDIRASAGDLVNVGNVMMRVFFFSISYLC